MKPIEVLRLVIAHLERLNIPYMLSGSFASSQYGRTRFTADADLVVNLRKYQVENLVELLRPDFYVDAGMIHEALARRSSFNAIHLESSFKVDFFILGTREFDENEFSRRRLLEVDRESEVQAHVQTPEDCLLSKLEWYRAGGGVSENQRRDVISILKTQAGRLDLAYLRRWATELNVADLFERALREAEGCEEGP